MTKTAEIFERVKKERPLVHHITNWVSIYDCANIVRAVGALPVMAHAIEESADMATISSSVVLNIGTLTNEVVEAMKVAGKAANSKNIPIVLDVVGAGATRYRNEKTIELIREVKIDIIKGNCSEIARVAGLDVFTKGVEATKIDEDLTKVAQKLACERQATVVITGRQDIIADKNSVYICRNGHEMMGKIVGTGCMSASLVGVFAAVEKDYGRAASAALVVFGIAGELAAGKSFGPGTFKNHLYDFLYNLSPSDIENLEKLEEVSC